VQTTLKRVPDMQPPFSIPGYLGLLESLKDLGYRLSSLGGLLADPQGQIAFIRHDVDIDLRGAVTLAEHEAEVGVAATYFISVQSPFLNLYASPELERLERLVKLGHEIAGHVDLRAAPVGFAAIDSLRAFVPGLRRDYVSVHSPRGGTPSPSSFGAVDVHDLCGDRGFKYLSDSQGSWREGHPSEHPAVLAGQPLHLNTHPIWWVEPGATSLDRLKTAVDTDVETGADAAWWFPKLANGRRSCRAVQPLADGLDPDAS
jgi:hypothetical protein